MSWAAILKGLVIIAFLGLVYWFFVDLRFIYINFKEIHAGAASAWLSASGLVLVALVLLAAWCVLRKVGGAPPTFWRMFGDTPAKRMIALGIVTLLYPRAVSSLIIAPVTIFSHLFSELPQAVLRAHPPQQIGGTISIEQILFRFSLIIQSIGTQLSFVLNRITNIIPVTEVILGLALWALVGQLLSAVSQPVVGSNEAGTSTRFVLYGRRMSIAQKYGVFLTLVFLIGAYLSVAAIVAIPWLHEEKVPEVLNRDNLEKALNELLPLPDTVAKRLLSEAVLDTDPLLSISEALGKLEAKSANLADEISIIRRAFTVSSLLSGVTEAREARRTAIDRWKQVSSDFVDRVSDMRRAALSAYDIETASPMSSQERGFFVRQIRESIYSQYAEIERWLTECGTVISATDRRLSDVANPVGPLFATASSGEPGDQQSLEDTAAISRFRQQISSAVRSLRDACGVLSESPVRYAPPEPGSSWGPFGIVARWLLRTKSLALALITGMLGFGLLGSAIATFVRTADRKMQDTSITNAVISVVVSGFSAAIVVFLAVKGSLAILSTGDNEPNAYVLFFTCLVGAVFSETVWGWARDKLEESLARREARREQQKPGKLRVTGSTIGICR